MAQKSPRKTHSQFFILTFTTPTYKNNEYIKNRDYYQHNLKKFHQLGIVKKTNLNQKSNFRLKLTLQNETLWTNKKIIWSQIKKVCSQMNIKSSNLSLYSDYNPQCSQKTFGFKNKDKALDTLRQLQEKPLKYQLQVITTMLGRAKYHPYKNKDMDQAIGVFENWVINYHKSK